MSKPIPPSASSDKADQITERPARRKPPGRSEHLELELSILESENALRPEDDESSGAEPRKPDDGAGEDDSAEPG